MATLTTFDSTKEALLGILQDIKEGKTQLPDFQRGWVWDDDHIKSILASISLSYPIGAVMMMQTGNTDVRFKPRLMEGVELTRPPEPERLILDGQQRLTSLFLALHVKKPVDTADARKKPIRRWYYIDMQEAIEPQNDREESIVSLPEDKKIRNFRGEVIEDLSEREKEYERALFPLSEIFDCSEWRADYNKYWNYEPEKVRLFDDFEKEIIKRFEQYQIPVIVMRKETPKEAVCQVFEKVNTGGVVLTVFELLTATFAADDFNLRTDWEARWKRLREHKVLGGMRNDDFLQTITLLSTYEKRREAMASETDIERLPGISCKRKEILRLTLEDYKKWADEAENGYIRAAKFMYKQKIFSAQDLPYRTQLIPLSAIFVILGSRSESDYVQSQLALWYWCGVFGELYGSAIETRFAKDLPEVVDWIDGAKEPATIEEANFVPARLLTLRTRNSAAYKGLYTLLIRDGGLELRSGEPIDLQMYFDDRIDIHHIFPRAWCEKHGIDANRCNSIVNKTAIGAKTNRIIGGNSPRTYLEKLEKSMHIEENRMNEILASHVIDPIPLRNDDFEGFFRKRMESLLQRIEKAMGKTINREAEDLETEIPYEEEEEEEATLES